MRTTRRHAPTAILLLCLAPACSKGDKPDAFVQASLKAASGEPQALWNALPKSYQEQGKALVVEFAGKMNEQLWNDGFGILQKATKVLVTKKDFVLGYPALASAPVKVEDVAKGADPAIRTLDRLVHSDLATLEGLKKLDIERFLAGPVAASTADLTQAFEVAAAASRSPDMPGLLGKVKSAKVTVESTEGDSAKVKVEVEGEKPETLEMVKVEGKWIPRELAQAWPAAIAKAHAEIAQIKIEPEMVAQFTAMKGPVDATLTGLLAAKTQAEFNAQVDGLLGGLIGGRSRPQIAQASPDDSAPAPAPKKAAKAPATAAKKAKKRH
jgi:hypothetical protein